MVKGEFFRAGLAYAMSKKFVIYFTQKNVSRFEFKKRNSLQIGDCFLFDCLKLFFQFFQMWFQKCRLRERCQFP